MIIYHYNSEGRFTGSTEANESPLEPGIFLIPANATSIEPPTFDSGFMAVFGGEAWNIIDITLEVPPIEQTPPEQPKTQAELLQIQNDALKVLVVTLQKQVNTNQSAIDFIINNF